MNDVEALMSRFNGLADEIQGKRTEGAVTAIVTQVEANSAGFVPIMTSNLINSSYKDVRRSLSGWRGEVGYNAGYAAYVHNAPGTLLGMGVSRGFDGRFGNVWDPGGEPKFLDKGVERTKLEIPLILRQNYK